MPTAFGKWLRAARSRSGFNLAELQAKTGINYTHISRMENGRSRPSRETVVKLAIALGASLQDALISAHYIPFDAPHLSDPDAQRLAADYHALPPVMKAFVRQAVEAAKKAVQEDREGVYPCGKLEIGRSDED